MEEEKTLVIWFPNGLTSYFEKVTHFDRDMEKGVLLFDYIGVSSQVPRSAEFNLDIIAGYGLEGDGFDNFVKQNVRDALREIQNIGY